MDELDNASDVYVVSESLGWCAVAILGVGTLMFGLGFVLVWDRTVLGAFLVSGGLSAMCLGTFFRPGPQSERAGCALFTGFIALAITAFAIGIYAVIQNIIH